MCNFSFFITPGYKNDLILGARTGLLLLFSDIMEIMLEKNEKKVKNLYCDAHFHLWECIQNQCFDIPVNWKGGACVLFEDQWELIKKNISDTDNQKLFYSFGIHPQFVCENNLEQIEREILFLEKLCQERKIKAVGEIGYDFFTDEYKSNAELQEKFFLRQLEIAEKYEIPVIIHCRKANHKLFEIDKQLKKLPAVLFHSFMGTPVEAQSLLNHGINAYFSFGKQMMNNNKKVIACVKELPLDRLLFETDAPYQTLKSEEKTYVSEIEKIYETAYSIRKESMPMSDFCNIILQNLLYLYHE